MSISSAPAVPTSRDHHSLAVFEATAPPPARTLIDIFVQTVRSHPHVVALESPTRQLSYLETATEAQRLADRLRTAGIGPGSRVGIRVPSGTVYLYLAILGTLHAGAAYVPVDWDDSADREATVFSEADRSGVPARLRRRSRSTLICRRILPALSSSTSGPQPVTSLTRRRSRPSFPMSLRPGRSPARRR